MPYGRVVQVLGDPIGRDEHLRVCVSTLGEARISGDHNCLQSMMMRFDYRRSLGELDACKRRAHSRFCINNYKNILGSICQPRDPAAQLAMFCQSVG